MSEICIGGENDQSLHFFDKAYNETHTHNVGFNPKGLCYNKGLWYCVDGDAVEAVVFDDELNEIKRTGLVANTRGIRVIDNMVWVTCYSPFRVFVFDMEMVLANQHTTADISLDVIKLDGNICSLVYHHAWVEMYNREWDVINRWSTGDWMQGFVEIDGCIHITDEDHSLIEIYDKEYNKIKDVGLGFAPHGIGYRR